VILSLLIIIVLVLIASQTAMVQSFAINKTTRWLEQKVGTKVNIGHFRWKGLNHLLLDGIYVEDRQADTLAAIDRLDIRFELKALFSQRLVINSVDAKEAVVIIKKDTSGRFNFDHFIEAFQTPAASEDTTASAAWEINLSDLHLQKVKFRYEDEQTPLKLATSIGELKTAISNFSLLNQNVAIDQWLLKETSIALRYAATEQDTNITAGTTELVFPDFGWTVKANTIDLQENRISYQAFGADQVPNTFDPAYIDASIEQLSLEDLEMTAEKIAVNIRQLRGKAVPQLELQELQAVIALTPQQLLLNDFRLETPYSTISHQTQLNYSQFSDLGNFIEKVTIESDIKQLEIHPNDIRQFSGAALPARINQPFLLTGKWQGTLANLNIENLKLNQPQTIQLAMTGQLQGLPNIDDLTFDLDIESLNTSHDKLSALLPKGTLPPGIARWKELRLRTKSKGRLQNFSASPIHLVTSAGPELHGRLTAKGLPDIDQSTFVFQMDTFITEVADWQGFAPDSLPEMLTRLGTIRTSGTYEGSIYKFTTKLKARTDLGTLSTDARLGFSKDYADATYDGNIQLDQFDLGAFLEDSLLGQFTLTAEIDGQGLQLEQINAKIVASVAHFSYNDYVYDSLNIDGSVKEGLFYGGANMKDKNLSFSFDGSAPVDGKMENLDFHLVLDTINLDQLNLYSSPLGARADLTLDANQLDIENWRGGLKIHDFAISDSSNYYRADSIIVKSIQTEEGQRSLVIDADFIHGRLTGNYQLATLGREISDWVSVYFPISKLIFPPDTAGQGIVAEELVPPTPDTEVQMELSLSDPSKLTDWLLPELKQLDTFHLSLDFNPRSSKWLLDAWSSVIQYGDYQIDSLRMTSRATDKAMSFRVFSKELSLGENTIVPRPAVEFNLEDQKLTSQLLANSLIKDSVLWRLGTIMTAEDETFKMRLATDPVFNGIEWTIAQDNRLSLMENGDYQITSLHLRKDEQELLIDGIRDQQSGKEKISMEFRQFLLQTLNPLLDLPNDYMTGQIYGKAQLNQLQTNLNYTTEIEVKDWLVDSTRIGDVRIDATQVLAEDAIQVGVTLISEKNNLKIAGEYDISERRFDLTGDIDYLTMRTFDPFLLGLISNSEGGLSGQFQLTGTPQKPLLKGQLKVTEASTKVEYTGTRFLVENGSVSFTENTVDLGEWTLKDELGNPATLKGKIAHRYFQDMKLGLNFQAKKFQFFNTTAANNELFYGRLMLDAVVDIDGSPEHPRFRISAETSPQTQFFVVPLTDEQNIVADDYIIFGKPQLDSLGRDTSLVDKYQLKTIGLDLSLDLNLKDNAELQIIVDPLTGDKLVCRGNANLSVDMNENGEVNIFGTYELAEGQYNFSYEQLAKRQFQLLKNSRITFAGDPLAARMDITAAYVTRVPLSDLLENQLTEQEGIARAGAQRTDVRVLLRMQGDLADPQLTFDIELVGDPQGELIQEAQNRLAQLRNTPSELNTQVFGLLLFNGFIKENAGQTLANAGQSAVWSSVGKLVSNKLNQLADQYLNGLSVNIGLDAYKPGVSGNSDLVTELEVSLSKKLFNDRLNIKVGGNLNVGGSSENGQGVATNFAGDFALEYALTPSGNYQLRVYRRSDFDALNQSNVTRSGAGFSLKKQFRGKRQKKKE